MTAATPATGRDWSDTVLNAYLAVFYAYLFLPLLLMVAAAFNASLGSSKLTFSRAEMISSRVMAWIPDGSNVSAAP